MQESDLKQHETTHTCEKRFSCSNCDKKFEQETDIEQHQRTHIEEEFNCKVCNQSFPKTLMIEKEVQIDSEEELSEIINTFFRTKTEKIEEKIPLYDIDPTSKLKKKLEGRNLKFSISEVTEAQVSKALKSLKSKTSSGLDFVSPKILKLSEKVICTPLTYAINSSISSGEFPNSWKCAKCCASRLRSRDTLYETPCKRIHFAVSLRMELLYMKQHSLDPWVRLM